MYGKAGVLSIRMRLSHPYLYTIVRNRILNQIRDMANEDKLKEHILSHAVDSANETNNKILFDDLKDVLAVHWNN